MMLDPIVGLYSPEGVLIDSRDALPRDPEDVAMAEFISAESDIGGEAHVQLFRDNELIDERRGGN